MHHTPERYVTVGIPTSNGASTIRNTLQQVLGQELPPSIDKMEVIVYANGCTDGTERVVESVATDSDGIELVSTRLRGRPNAWRCVKGLARSDVVVFVDDDITLGDGLVVRRLYEDLLAKPDIQIAGGKIISTYRPSWFLIDGMNRIHTRPARRKTISGGLYAMRRDIPLEMPLDIIHDDVWLSLSLGPDRILLDQDAIAYHEMPFTIRDYMKYRARVEAGLLQLRDEYGMDTRPVRQVRSRLHLLRELPLRDMVYLPAVAAFYLWGKLDGWAGYHSGRLNHQYERYAKAGSD